MVPDFVIFGLLAATCFATANVIDKILMTEHVEHPMVKAFYYGLFAPIIALPALFISGIVIPRIQVLIIALIAGGSFFLTSIIIMRAMQLEEVSKLALLKQLTPIFVVGLSFLILDELLSINQYLGIGILIFAGLLSTLNHPAEGLPGIAFDKPFFLVIISNFFAALSFVLLKYLLEFTDIWTALYWEQVGIFMAAPLVMIAGSKYRAETKDILFNKPRSLVLLLFSAAALVGANLSLTAGFSRASASIVASINTINPLFTLIFVVILQRLNFEHFEENLTKTEIVVKTLATLLFVAGIYLVR